jgi:hypothetical protein
VTKQNFTLGLVPQAIDRTCDEVWHAVRASNDARVKKLWRLLGFGLLTLTADGRVMWRRSQRHGATPNDVVYRRRRKRNPSRAIRPGLHK